MSRNRRKAFTLTELLVVVVVIGVLAAVVLPKYTKVIETRKTTEAENMMAAVRTEQERRCALDKSYIGNDSKLVSAGIVPSMSTQNFYYSLLPQGMKAKHLGKYIYALKMPSYADGRICCEGQDCNKLNKEYPNCDALVTQVDYREAISCAAGIPEEPVSHECPGSDIASCGCENKGTKTRSCNYTTGEWGEWSPCSIGDCEEPDTLTCEAWFAQEKGGVEWEIYSTGKQVCAAQDDRSYNPDNTIKGDATSMNDFIEACCGDPLCPGEQFAALDTAGNLLGCCADGEDYIREDGGSGHCGTCESDDQRQALETDNSVTKVPIVRCAAGKWVPFSLGLTAVKGLGAFADYAVARSTKISVGPAECNQYFIGTQATQTASCSTKESAEAWCNEQCGDNDSCSAICYASEPNWGEDASMNVDMERVSSCNDAHCSLETVNVSIGVPAGYRFVGWTSQPSITTTWAGTDRRETHQQQLSPACGHGCGVPKSCTEGSCTARTLNASLSAGTPMSGFEGGQICAIREQNLVQGYACVRATNPVRPSQSACPGLSTGVCYVE